jgi:hypothetical protein
MDLGPHTLHKRATALRVPTGLLGKQSFSCTYTSILSGVQVERSDLVCNFEQTEIFYERLDRCRVTWSAILCPF